MSTDNRDRQGVVPISYKPIQVEEEADKFWISPLAIINHVNEEPDRELEKTILDDSVEYRVYSGVEYDEDDSSQRSWEKEYGIECFENGRAKIFVDYEPVNSTPESAQSTIRDRVFKKLEKRSLRYYARNGITEAAEIIRGEKP